LKLRILHVGKFFPPFVGGIENFLADLSLAQTKLGNEIYVLVHNHIFRQAKRQENWKGVKIVRSLTLGQLFYTPLTPTLPIDLLYLIRNFKPHILHLHVPNPIAIWAPILAPKTKIVLHWHSDVIPSSFDKKLQFLYRLYRPFERFLLNRADLIIATSPHYRDTSLSLQNFLNKTAIVPLGINPKRIFIPDKSQIERIKRNFLNSLILSVGRLTYYKGFSYLIEAMASVPSATLLLIGSGNQKRFLLRKIEELNLGERVKLMSGVSDPELHSYMSACKVFCLPSVERTEAFGLVLLEALFFGRPLITTKVLGSGMNWINKDHETGLVVPPADSQALAKAINCICNNSVLYQKLANGARARFEEKFHINNVACQIQSLYESVLSS